MTANQINVLVVDDEKAICEMIIIALSRAGMKARSAENGNEESPPIFQLRAQFHC